MSRLHTRPANQFRGNNALANCVGAVYFRCFHSGEFLEIHLGFLKHKAGACVCVCMFFEHSSLHVGALVMD